MVRYFKTESVWIIINEWPKILASDFNSKTNSIQLEKQRHTERQMIKCNVVIIVKN